MIKIAICDDIREDAEALFELTKETELFPGADYSLFSSGESILKAVEEGQIFELVLLDINMPGINGIEVGKRITEKIPFTILIYVTNYPEYAIDAFDSNAFHYVLKCEKYEKIYGVLSKAKASYVKSNKSYIVRTKRDPTHLLLSEIKYIEYCDKHLVFYTDRGRYTERGQIGLLAAQIEGFGFIQVHQGYVVNAKWIKIIQTDSVILIDGTEVMMSQKKRKSVKEKYERLIKAN